MAIESTFYDTIPGQGVNELEWAHSASSRGPDYGVIGTGDLMLTAHPTTPYAVVLSAGEFFGHGVWDKSDASVTVQCDTVVSGATRWDLIVAHRDWTPTGGGPTVLDKVNGTATKAIPVTRANTPGEVDDQPLWLVQWKGGQAQPSAIVDLRCWAGNGGMVIADILARDYLARPGAAVRLGGATHLYNIGTNGVWGWVIDKAFASGTKIITFPASYKSITASVPLPAGFSVPPTISLTMTSNIAYPATRVVLAAINKTKSQFEIKLATDDGATLKTTYELEIDWLAVP